MLYIVPTPIGNLEDITLRALRIIKEADYILTEDTRKTGLLLKHFEVPKKSLISFYEHNEAGRIPQVISLLQEEKNVALLSRAGTPLVSDPGYRLVQECIRLGLELTSLPGPTAVTVALTLSGLPTDSFIFLGFLPRKQGKRAQRIQRAQDMSSTVIFFESPQRLIKTLNQVKGIIGERKVCVCREVSKIHEEVLRGELSAVIEALSQRTIKGECTVVLAGK